MDRDEAIEEAARRLMRGGALEIAQAREMARALVDMCEAAPEAVRAFTAAIRAPRQRLN